MMNDNVDHLWGNLQTDHSACQYVLPLSRTGEDRPISFPLLPFLFHRNVPRQPIPHSVKGGDGSSHSLLLCGSPQLPTFHTLPNIGCQSSDYPWDPYPFDRISYAACLGAWPHETARISLVVWWFFWNYCWMFECISKGGLARPSSHLRRPLLVCEGFDLRQFCRFTLKFLCSAPPNHLCKHAFVKPILWSTFSRSCTIVWLLNLSVNHGLCSANNSNHKLLNINKRKKTAETWSSQSRYLTLWMTGFFFLI